MQLFTVQFCKLRVFLAELLVQALHLLLLASERVEHAVRLYGKRSGGAAQLRVFFCEVLQRQHAAGERDAAAGFIPRMLQNLDQADRCGAHEVRATAGAHFGVTTVFHLHDAHLAMQLLVFLAQWQIRKLRSVHIENTHRRVFPDEFIGVFFASLDLLIR